ncbi:MAG: outer membrane protein assembly factor BamC [Thiotrichales bacterium]
MRGTGWIGLSLALALIAGCGTLRGTENEAYLDSRGVGALKAPPPLVLPERDPTYQIPGAAAGVASARPASQPPSIDAAAPSTVRESVRERTEGQLSWLEVDRSPDQVWESLRGFWRSQDIQLAEDRPEIGAMRTEWIDESPNLSQSQLQSAVSEVTAAGGQALRRHQYRLRVERSQSGSNVYLTYQGASLVRGADSKPTWQLLPANTELEAAMLQRLKRHLAQR